MSDSIETTIPHTRSGAVGNSPAAGDNVTTILQRAEQALGGGEDALAHTLFKRATELDSNCAAAWAGRASTAAETDDAILSWACALAMSPTNTNWQAAFDVLIRAKTEMSGPGDVPSLVALGRRVAELGHKSSAHQLFARATELDDTQEEAWVWQAGTTDDLRESVRCLNQALKLNPENLKAKAGLEWANKRLGGEPKQDPPTSETKAAELIKEGLALMARDEKARARELFVRATEIDPKSETAWLWRGSCTAEVDEALACINQALAINPENASALEARSWLQVRKLRDSAKKATPPRTQLPPPSASSNSDRAQSKSASRWLIFIGILILLVILGIAARFLGLQYSP